MKITENVYETCAQRFGTIEFDGVEYALTVDAYPANGADGAPVCAAYAIRKGDTPDENGDYDEYAVEWTMDDPHAEDGANWVNDWSAPDKVVLHGGWRPAEDYHY